MMSFMYEIMKAKWLDDEQKCVPNKVTLNFFTFNMLFKNQGKEKLRMIKRKTFILSLFVLEYTASI